MGELEEAVNAAKVTESQRAAEVKVATEVAQSTAEAHTAQTQALQVCPHCSTDNTL